MNSIQPTGARGQDNVDGIVEHIDKLRIGKDDGSGEQFEENLPGTLTPTSSQGSDWDYPL